MSQRRDHRNVRHIGVRERSRSRPVRRDDRHVTRNIHMTVPMHWIRPDHSALKRPIEGATVVQIQQIKFRPHLFSVNIMCDSESRALDLIRRFNSDKYRRQKVFCEPFLTKSERVRRKAKRMPRQQNTVRPQKLKQSRYPRRRIDDIELCLDFNTETPSFASEDSPVRFPSGRQVRFVSVDEIVNRSLSSNEEASPERPRIPSRPIENWDEMVCYSSDSDVPYLG